VSEPVITINGVELSGPQAMLVRVLVDRFEEDIQVDRMAEDEHGRARIKSCVALARSILALMKLS
jgi:hypothetical protein